jgi:hypothetical protein
MPLASLASLQFYGTATGAAVTQGAGSTVATIKGLGRLAHVGGGAGSLQRARGTLGVVSGAAILASSSAFAGPIKGRGRMGAIIKVNELSQDDVTGAVLEALIEPGLTLREALRLVAAATAGKLSGAGTSTETIRNAVGDSKNRIVATVDSSGNRTAITYDLT